MRLIAMLLVALLIATPTPPHQSRRAAFAPSCWPVDDRLRTPDTARIRSGTYRLWLVATDGRRTNHRTSGVLRLWPTSAADRSPSWPNERPPAGDTAESPLYGSVALDWSTIAAPVVDPDPAEPRQSSDEPASDSRDPLHPGVLVRIQNWQHPGLRQERLLIGTLSNRRVADIRPAFDGSGIILSVRQITDAGFNGTWVPSGISVTGMGYFCSTRLSE